MKFYDLITLLLDYNKNIRISVYLSSKNRYLNTLIDISDELKNSNVKNFTFENNKLNVVL